MLRKTQNKILKTLINKDFKSICRRHNRLVKYKITMKLCAVGTTQLAERA